MEAREVEIDEVLPKEARAVRGNDPLMAFVARLMDNQFSIPGTRLRFGLDPLLGLLPGWGDSASAFISVLLLLNSARAGVPRPILAQMAGNILVNALLGAVPVAGDAFSFWFKSNAKNYALHQRFAGTGRKLSKRDWLVVVLLLGGLLALIGVLFLAMLGFVVQGLHWLFQPSRG